MSRYSKVSAADLLKTLELYVELQNASDVGSRLGITATAVRERLKPLGIKFNSRSDRVSTFYELNKKADIDKLLAKLRREAAREAEST